MGKVDEIINKMVTFLLELAINNQGVQPESLHISETAIVLIRPLWSELSLVGFGLTIVFFVVEINKIYAFEGRDMNIKSFLKPFLKFAVALYALSNATEIISTFLNWHNSFVTFVDGAFSAGDLGDLDGNSVAQDLLDSMSTVTKIISVFFLCPTFSFGLIMSLVWTYKAYGYQFELIYRVGITPIALADIYSGMNANAIKWLKGFFGLALYGVSFMAIPRLGTIIMIDQFTKSLDALMDGSVASIIPLITTLLGALLVPVAELGVLSTIKQMCKEAIG